MREKPTPALVLLAAWLLPGGGHFLLRRRTQAVFFFLVITIVFVGGMWLSDFTNVSPERHRYYFVAQIWNGAEAFLAMFLTQDLIAREVPHHLGTATGEIGLLYTAVAALLNVMVMMDAWGIRMGLGKTSEKPQ